MFNCCWCHSKNKNYFFLLMNIHKKKLLNFVWKVNSPSQICVSYLFKWKLRWCLLTTILSFTINNLIVKVFNHLLLFGFKEKEKEKRFSVSDVIIKSYYDNESKFNLVCKLKLNLLVNPDGIELEEVLDAGEDAQHLEVRSPEYFSSNKIFFFRLFLTEKSTSS